jgi:hypothetical protein
MNKRQAKKSRNKIPYIVADYSNNGGYTVITQYKRINGEVKVVKCEVTKNQ